MKLALHAALVASLLLVPFVAEASPPGPSGGIAMVPWVAPDESYSLAMPEGWTAVATANGVAIAQNAFDKTSAHVDIMIFEMKKPDITATTIISLVVGEMVNKYSTFKLVKAKQVPAKIDTSGVLFSYEEEGTLINGFCIAMCQNGACFWADVYGSDKSFEGLNAGNLLGYMVQSLSQTTTPAKPAVTLAQLTQPVTPVKPPAATGEGKGNDDTSQKKLEKAAIGAHMWNMAPYIAPSVFTHSW